MNHALLMIDVQNDIVKKDEGRLAPIIKNIETVAGMFRKQKQPIYLFTHIYEEGQFLLKDSEGAEVYSNLNIPSPDDEMEKYHSSCFKETDLKERLEELNVSELVLCGFNSEYCIDTTAKIAFELGFEVTVIDDATGSCNTGEDYEYEGDFDPHDFLMATLQNSGIATIVSTKDWLRYA